MGNYQKIPCQIAAFFDVDLTITSIDSFRLFLKIQYCFNIKYLPLSFYVFLLGLARKLNFISLQIFKESALFCLKGKSKSCIMDIGNFFFQKYLVNFIRHNATEKITSHINRGHKVFLITSSPDIYIDPMMRYLSCDGYECSRLEYLNDEFSGHFIGKDCLGSEKVARLKSVVKRESLDSSKSFAYTDHESDLPLLEWVGNPTVVSPTSKLRHIAIEKGWKIEEW